MQEAMKGARRVCTREGAPAVHWGIRETLNKSVRIEPADVHTLWHKGFDRLSLNGTSVNTP
jgi:hypothetical protein